MNKIKNIISVIKRKHLISRLLILFTATLISSLVYNLLERPAQIVTGGSTGISIIVEYLFGFEPSLIIFVISISMLLLSFIFLGIEKTSSAIISAFLFPTLVKLTSGLSNYIKIDTSDMLLISIFIGVISGVYNGLIYKAGFSGGGISTISHILYRYKKISITTTNLVINTFLVIGGGFLFGWNKVMYALIILYIYTLVADRVLLGVSKNKNVFIITNNYEEMNNYIVNELKHGVTMFDAEGGITQNRRKVLMTAVPNSEYFKLKQGAKHIDPKVFFIVTDSYQVQGGK